MFLDEGQAQKCSLFLITLSGAETLGNTKGMSEWLGL